MFRSLVKFLFPAQQSEAKSNFFYFEESKNDSSEKETVTEATPALQTSFTFQSKELLTIEEKHQAQFYDFLFGQSPPTRMHDELSEFVAEKIHKLLKEPKYILASLPVLPASLSKVLAQLNDDDFNVDILLELIEHEPVMVAKVLELANSAYYNHNNKEIVDLKSAFMLLGVNGLIEGVINGFVSKLTPQSQIYFKQYGNKIWQHSHATGTLAKELINSSAFKEDAAQGYLIGLICNLGDMIIFQLATEAFSFVHPDCQPNSYAFKELMQRNSKKLTFNIAKYWHFPEAILAALAIQVKIQDKTFLTKLFKIRPVTCFVYEANIISKLVMMFDCKYINETEFTEMVERLLISKESKQYINSYLQKQLAVDC